MPITNEQIKCAILSRLHREYGDLNTAYVAMCQVAHGVTTISAIAARTGLSRNAVRRALRRLSERDGAG